MWGERRPPDDPGEAEERDGDGSRLPEEGGQGGVTRKARGGVAGTAAPFVSGIAASTGREQDGIAGLVSIRPWAPAPSSPAVARAISSGAPASCALMAGAISHEISHRGEPLSSNRQGLTEEDGQEAGSLVRGGVACPEAARQPHSPCGGVAAQGPKYEYIYLSTSCLQLVVQVRGIILLLLLLLRRRYNGSSAQQRALYNWCVCKVWSRVVVIDSRQ